MAVKFLKESDRSNIEDYSIEEVIDMYNDGYFELIPKSDDFPMPWDSDLSYDSSKDMVILTGGVSAGGGAYGKCVVSFPAKYLWKFFKKG